jgi:hypothetical protein
VSPSVVVYDHPKIREIGFPSMWNTYTTDLADTIRRDGAQAELRGINDRFGDGDCAVNLMWAASRK